ncbi:hypothetical protein P8452_43496 [Trifolium repens]|nr:hypothetical protein P8452_43496 [Trifolium repens]
MVYNEQKNVNENCVDVSEILPGKENESIKVRIVRMWKAPAFLNPSETNSLEMVLIDSKAIYGINFSIRNKVIWILNFGFRINSCGLYLCV